MLARIGGTADSIVALIPERRATDAAVLLRTLLESVVAFTFMERHWSQVTRRLSEGMARDMAALVDMYESSTGKDDIAQLVDIGQNRFGLSVAVLPAGNLPTLVVL